MNAALKRTNLMNGSRVLILLAWLISGLAYGGEVAECASVSSDSPVLQVERAIGAVRASLKDDAWSHDFDVVAVDVALLAGANALKGVSFKDSEPPVIDQLGCYARVSIRFAGKFDGEPRFSLTHLVDLRTYQLIY